MKAHFFLILFYLICSPCVFSKNLTAKELIEYELKKNTIEKIQLSWIPSELLTRTKIDPASFENFATNHFETKLDSSTANSFKEYLLLMSFSETDRAGDIRSKITFIGTDGQPILNLYLSKYGDQGYVNDIVVNVKSNNLTPKLKELMNSKIDDGFNTLWIAKLLRFFQ